MRTVRVYSNQTLACRNTVILLDEAARHVTKVLRMRAGDPLVLFDGSGSDYSGAIKSIERDRVTVEVGSECEAVAESPLKITLWHGVCRGSRMDYVVQKATELGVSALQPVLVERSVVKLDGDRARKKTQHWQGIAISAAEQSGRSVVPEVHEPATLDVCLAAKDSATVGLILHPGNHPGIATLLADQENIILFTGPEGGFTDREYETAVTAGFLPAAIGPRVLRSETAPVAALAIAQYAAGDLA
jgi:16S rRNA (uracil1498-N3)-methyltransferase